MEKSGSGNGWRRSALACVCFLLLTGSAAHAQGSGPSAADVFRYNDSGQLEYYDEATGHWLPTRVTGGVVEFQSGGEWWPSGYTDTQVYEAIGYPGTNSSAYQSFRRMQHYAAARRQARNVAGDYRQLRLTMGRPWQDSVPACGLGASMSPQDVPPAEIPEWDLRWNVSGGYRSDDFDIVGGAPGAAKTRTRFQSVNLTAVRDRFGVSAALTYDRIDPDDAFGDIAYDRLSLRVTPVATLLEQAADQLDVHLITSFGLGHSWFEQDVDFDDPSDVFAAAGLGLGRTFRFGDVRLVYLYSVSKNISGDEEVTGKSTIPIHTVSASYAVPLTKEVLMSVGLDWQHTSDLPSAYDADEMFGRASLSYSRGRWGASLRLDRSINSGNQREWTMAGGVSYAW